MLHNILCVKHDRRPAWMARATLASTELLGHSLDSRGCRQRSASDGSHERRKLKIGRIET